jgi:hypothetical protein
MWNVFLSFIFLKLAQIDKRPTTDFCGKTSITQNPPELVWSFSARLFAAFDA